MSVYNELIPLVHVLMIALMLLLYSNATVELCQANCDSSDRLVGPTRMRDTLTHPWKVAEFPSASKEFCRLGCTYFFSMSPQNYTCKNVCGYSYRYQTTSKYSDIAEEAILECQDGCDIALLICQSGFYCANGEMLPCLAGSYREPTKIDLSIISLSAATTCTLCPAGRYLPSSKGKSPDSCKKCPLGKYADVTGSKVVSDCKRCPAGTTAEEEGMASCKFISPQSDDLQIKIDGFTPINYYKNGVDYYRETIPYSGRS